MGLAPTTDIIFFNCALPIYSINIYKFNLIALIDQIPSGLSFYFIRKNLNFRSGIKNNLYMPHLKLEYTSNISHQINFNELFLELHRVLVDYADVDYKNCKSRAIKLDDFVIGKNEDENAFVHLELKFLEGRTDQKKREIGWDIMKILEDFYHPCFVTHNFQISLEIIDILNVNYFKIPNHNKNLR